MIVSDAYDIRLINESHALTQTRVFQLAKFHAHTHTHTHNSWQA